MKTASSLWLAQLVAYYHRRINDVPWLIIGNYLAAWITLGGAGFFIHTYEYRYFAEIWQPLIPTGGPSILVPAALILVSYLIFPTRFGFLPGLLIIGINTHLHLAPLTSPIGLDGVLLLLWHVAIFPMLILSCCFLIGELTWPFVRAIIAIRHAWAKQRIMTKRLAYERARMLAEDQITLQHESLMLKLHHQKLTADAQDVERRLKIEQRQREVTYQQAEARLTFAQAEAAKLLGQANEQLVNVVASRPTEVATPRDIA